MMDLRDARQLYLYMELVNQFKHNPAAIKIRIFNEFKRSLEKPALKLKAKMGTIINIILLGFIFMIFGV